MPTVDDFVPYALANATAYPGIPSMSPTTDWTPLTPSLVQTADNVFLTAPDTAIQASYLIANDMRAVSDGSAIATKIGADRQITSVELRLRVTSELLSAVNGRNQLISGGAGIGTQETPFGYWGTVDPAISELLAYTFTFVPTLAQVRTTTFGVLVWPVASEGETPKIDQILLRITHDPIPTGGLPAASPLRPMNQEKFMRSLRRSNS